MLVILYFSISHISTVSFCCLTKMKLLTNCNARWDTLLHMPSSVICRIYLKWPLNTGYPKPSLKFEKSTSNGWTNIPAGSISNFGDSLISGFIEVKSNGLFRCSTKNELGTSTKELNMEGIFIANFLLLILPYGFMLILNNISLYRESDGWE